MTVKQANIITGGLSTPSKLPCRGWGIPAKYCNIGSKLRKLPGSVCADCYALKGRYAFANVQTAEENRLELWRMTRAEIWGNAMETLIKKQSPNYFRWFDAGDLQNEKMFLDIVCLARRLPKIKFWLPTRERGIILKMTRQIRFPKNLIVRLSAPMVDGEPLRHTSGHNELAYSGVSSKGTHNCPAPKQDNDCGRCRACWTQPQKTIIYKLH